MGPGPSLSQSCCLCSQPWAVMSLISGAWAVGTGLEPFIKQFTVNSPLCAQCPEQRSLGEEGLEARATMSPPREGVRVEKTASFLGWRLNNSRVAGGGINEQLLKAHALCGEMVWWWKPHLLVFLRPQFKSLRPVPSL